MRRHRALAAALTVLAVIAVSASSAAAATTRITFYFGLKRPERAAVRAFYAVQSPDSARYRRFLTPSQMSSRYGAAARTRSAFARALQRLGLSAQVDRSGVFARVSGTVTQLERVFGVRIKTVYSDDVHATSYFVPGGLLHLPAVLRPLVAEVVPDYAHSSPPPTQKAMDARAGPRAPGNAGTWVHGCAAARATRGYSYAQVRQAYGINKLGSGVRSSVAILNDAEGFAQADLDRFDRCFGAPAHRTRTLLTDGQAAPFPIGTFEPLEDLALVRGIGTQLRSVLFTQVWGTPGLWFLGPAKLLALSRRPDSFSISYGYCESQVLGPRAPRDSRQGARLLNSLLVRLGLAGVSVFASAGDFGSSCNGERRLGVTWPASSPFVTAVGGTRLVVDKANQRVREVGWNDLRWLSPNNGGGAGGGGFSSFYARPRYQRRIPFGGRRRTVPDIAVHASMLPGYPVVLGGHWVTDAGTSAAAPLAATAFALISGTEQAAGRAPLGPLNGLIYWLGRHDRAALYDIVTGATGYYPNVPPRRARRGYDLATGWGVPRFERIVAVLGHV